MSTKRNHERAAVRIARKLVSEIRRRRLRPGSQLDAEHRMVEELGVSRWSECQTCDEILGIRLGPKKNVSASVILFFINSHYDTPMADHINICHREQPMAPACERSQSPRAWIRKSVPPPPPQKNVHVYCARTKRVDEACAIGGSTAQVANLLCDQKK